MEAFGRRYASAYLRHHEAYNADMAALGHRMAAIRLEALALGRLNEIQELGESVGVGLLPLVEELYNSIGACSAQLVAEEVQRVPRCRACGVRLSSQVPAREVESLGSYVHDALQKQNQRLSGWVVHHLVQGQESEQIDRFIKVVQVSDLSGLAHTLTDEVVEFIRDLLTGPGKLMTSGTERWVIVGLGNPGSRYAQSRHNVGFRCVELLAERHGISLGERRQQVVLGQGPIGDRPVVVAKPRTYVNASGAAVRYLLQRFGVNPAKLLVVTDDMDLPLGKLRLRGSGGSGGHHGLDSIIDELGSQAFPRLRIGIGRPGGEAIEHVLGLFLAGEEEALAQALDLAVQAVEMTLAQGLELAMNKFNTRQEEGGPQGV